MVHWLLLYKDPAQGDRFANADFNTTIDSTMRKMVGLNALIGPSSAMADVLVCLEGAKITAEKEPFDWRIYKKLVLDAHNAIDKIEFSATGRPCEEVSEDVES